MGKIYQKKDFGTAEMAEMKPGQVVTVMCKNFAEVNSLRASAVQFIKTREPDDIDRFATIANREESGEYSVELTAISK